MTTIAFDGKTMASDSQQEGNFIDSVKAVKIHRTGDRLVGVAGNGCMTAPFLEFLRTGEKSDSLNMKGTEALVVSKQGAFWYGFDLQPVPAGIPSAIGSGAGYAMAAMYCGKSAGEAVEVACRLDASSGGELQEFKMK